MLNSSSGSLSDMKINLRTTHIDLGDAMTDYLTEKINSLSKFIERFEEKGEAVIDIEIMRTTQHHKQGDVYGAHINLDVAGDVLRLEEEDEDVRALIDKVKDKLKNEILRYKERKEEI